jgi:hypothetical protein
MGTAFDHALKRHGIDCAALPRDLEEFACGECGRRYLENVYGRDADTRRELRELSEDYNRCLVARTAIPDELSQRLKELEDRLSKCFLALHGAAYTEALEAADEAADEAMHQWFNEHEAESGAALNRAPLVQRRGLAA